MLSTETYGYGNANWGDLLTSYNDLPITYDNIGNPLTYWIGYNDCYLTWEGRQLKSLNVMYMSNYTYEYNDAGIRTQKNIDGVVHNYTVDGSKILKEHITNTDGSQKTLYYFYDSNGSIIGFNINGGMSYYFGKNAQGDVKYIYKQDRTLLVEYCYDAWGNVVKTLNGNGQELQPENLEELMLVRTNPFRYRGYYYDSETGFYYLNSRYYDPQVGRFISADGIIGANGDIQGYNMFAYCSNNPVNCL